MIISNNKIWLAERRWQREKWFYKYFIPAVGAVFVWSLFATKICFG